MAICAKQKTADSKFVPNLSKLVDCTNKWAGFNTNWSSRKNVLRLAGEGAHISAGDRLWHNTIKLLPLCSLLFYLSYLSLFPFTLFFYFFRIHQLFQLFHCYLVGPPRWNDISSCFRCAKEDTLPIIQILFFQENWKSKSKFVGNHRYDLWLPTNCRQMIVFFHSHYTVQSDFISECKRLKLSIVSWR